MQNKAQEKNGQLEKKELIGREGIRNFLKTEAVPPLLYFTIRAAEVTALGGAA